jgi:hypothetical protein
MWLDAISSRGRCRAWPCPAGAGARRGVAIAVCLVAVIVKPEALGAIVQLWCRSYRVCVAVAASFSFQVELVLGKRGRIHA